MAFGTLDLQNATAKRGTTVPSTIKRTSDMTCGLLFGNCCCRNCIVHHKSLNFHCCNISKVVDTELFDVILIFLASGNM
jgi:hypothetical protein